MRWFHANLSELRTEEKLDTTIGRPISLIITRAGRDAIGIEDDAGETQPPVETGSAKPSSATATAENPPPAGSPRAGSKLALIVAMLTKVKGATLAALVEATGWLPHTTRAGDDGTSQAGFCDRADPPRKAGIALSDRRDLTAPVGLNRWQSQP